MSESETRGLQEEKENKTADENRKRKRDSDVRVENESQRNVNHSTNDEEATKLKKIIGVLYNRERQGIPAQKIPKVLSKSKAEKTEAYKDRKKIMESAEFIALWSESLARPSTSNFAKPAAIARAEINEVHRERQKIQITETVDTTSITNLLSPDHGAERQLYTGLVHNEERDLVEIQEPQIEETRTAHEHSVDENNERLQTETHKNVRQVNFNEIQEAPIKETLTANRNVVLSSRETEIDSVADDIFLGCGDNFENERVARLELHKLSPIYTGGLQYHITFALNQLYMITSNIDVADGLVNGEIGELVYVESDDINNKIIRLWLIFPKTVGAKARSKNDQYAGKLGISNQATPIGLRSATFPVYPTGAIRVRRRHFPLKAACSMTTQGETSDKAQGETSVNTQGRGHSQSLVSAARITSPERLYIIPQNNESIFYRERQEDDTVTGLKMQLDKLSTLRLQKCDRALLNEMNLEEMTIFSFNCRSLNALAKDSANNVLKNSDLPLVSGTWPDRDKRLELENLLCIVKYKRPDSRVGDVGLYENLHKLQHAVSEHADIFARNADFISTQSSSVGDLCAALCTMPNGEKIMLVSVYMSLGESFKDIQGFIHHALLPYTEGGSKLLNEKYHEIPMIFAGNFNINFADEESLPFIHFLKKVFNVDIVHRRTVGTATDAVFSRFIDPLSTNICVSHFNYHKPIDTILKNDVSIDGSENNL